MSGILGMALALVFATHSHAAPERPVPRWKDIQRETSLPLYPVLSDGKRTYVSLHGPGSRVAAETLREIEALVLRTRAKEPFLLTGSLKKRVLSDLRILPGHSVHWFPFDRARLEKTAILNVRVFPNLAGDGSVGTLGIDLESIGTRSSTTTAIGLASIGAESLITPGPAPEADWKDVAAMVPEGRELALADHLRKLDPEEHGTRKLERRLAFRSVKFGGAELVEAAAKLVRSFPTQVQSTEESLLGYFVRRGEKVWTVRDFYLDDMYAQRPETVRAGSWVKGYEGAAYFSSTGMGNCGELLLVRKDGEPVAVPVLCGNWGC
jgi:hypothetical protein